MGRPPYKNKDECKRESSSRDRHEGSMKGDLMGRIPRCHRYRAAVRNRLIPGGFVLLALCVIPVQAPAEMPRTMADCAKIENDAARLKCYDQLAGPKSAKDAPVTGLAEKPPEEKTEKVSYFSRLCPIFRRIR
jgi:hypothetical protein